MHPTPIINPCTGTTPTDDTITSGIVEAATREGSELCPGAGVGKPVGSLRTPAPGQRGAELHVLGREMQARSTEGTCWPHP